MSTPSRQMPGAAGAGASRAGAQREEAIAREKVKILLVDDNPDNLVSIEAALDTLDEELVSARSGTEAVR
jgi:response regulator RpfG family c-di-GMP phosphodiesterase